MTIERGEIWWVNLGPAYQIRAVDKKRFVTRAGILGGADLRNLEAAVKQALMLS
jgi:mRNA-degrading endonuclease toxin of MazEF toxin-antitoxin module